MKAVLNKGTYPLSTVFSTVLSTIFSTVFSTASVRTTRRAWLSVCLEVVTIASISSFPTPT